MRSLTALTLVALLLLSGCGKEKSNSNFVNLSSRNALQNAQNRKVEEKK